ncbi:MAG: protein kinase [Polyangiaceae bacterium]
MLSPHQVAEGAIFAGDFRVLRPLSAGGMGAVYVAEQLSTGKPRALKLMHPQLVADARLRERFEQEARVGALIQSDHVVQVIGAGVDAPSGMPWLAMELLEGEDLAHYLRRRGHVSPAELCEVFRQLCHALGAAHAVGVVHRDLKPENIYLARSQSSAAPTALKVLDFGIAKVVADAKHTSTATIGTPLWMAPEQTDPRAPITPAADVWPLGLLAFWLLTGRVFWMVAHDPLSSMQAVLKELLLAPLPTASQRAAELGCGELIPPGFDEWFAACVARDPTERFANANDVRAALRAALPAAAAQQVSLAPPPSSAPWTGAATGIVALSPGDHGPTQRSPGVATPVPPSLHGVAPQVHGLAGTQTYGGPPSHPPPSSTGARPPAGEWPGGAPTPAPYPSQPPPSAGHPGMATAPVLPMAYPYPTPPGPHGAAAMGHAPVAPKKSSALLPVLALGGVALLALIGVGTAWGLGAFDGAGGKESSSVTPASPSSDDPSLPAPDPTGRPASPGQKPKPGGPFAVPTANPSVAVPAAPGTGGPAATPKVPTPPSTSPAAPTKKPFDAGAAHVALQKAGGNAQFHCKGKEGPKAVTATVFFNPESGAVQRTQIAPQVAATQSGLCVQMLLGSARVEPFAGDQLQSVTTTVAVP